VHYRPGAAPPLILDVEVGHQVIPGDVLRRDAQRLEVPRGMPQGRQPALDRLGGMGAAVDRAVQADRVGTLESVMAVSVVTAVRDSRPGVPGVLGCSSGICLVRGLGSALAYIVSPGPVS
jgi:hypothetical protein